MKKQPKYTTENQVFANLEKYQSIDVEGDWNVVKDRIDFRKSRKITPIWRAAAIAIILLGIGILARQYVNTPTATIIALAGEVQKDVLLPDGSQVHLNSYAELTYPKKFNRNIREVKLSGEGFFEVSNDAAHPFRINVADKASVEVLGTSFNINSSNGNGSVSVQVVDGRVAFYSNDNPESRVILGKDNQANLHNGEITRRDINDLNFLSWKTGIIQFDQDEISDVIQVLGKYYNREFTLDKSVDASLTFTSTFDNQELESVLEELGIVLGILHKKEGNSVILFMAE